MSGVKTDGEIVACLVSLKSFMWHQQQWPALESCAMCPNGILVVTSDPALSSGYLRLSGERAFAVIFSIFQVI